MAKRRKRKPLTIRQKLAVLSGISSSGKESEALLNQYNLLDSIGGWSFVQIAETVASESFPVPLKCLVMRIGFRGAMEEIERRIDTLLATMRRKRF